MKKIICLLITIAIFSSGCSGSRLTEESAHTETTAPTRTQTPSPTPTDIPTAAPTATAAPSPTPTPEPLYLKGCVIGIDPGHQDHSNHNTESVSPYYSKDKIKVSLGAKGIESGVREYIFNLEISLLLKDALEAQGAEVFMTRQTNDVDISNQERARMVKEADCDIWIRIHANYSSDREKTGISMLTPKYRSVSTGIYEQSRLLSGLVQRGVIGAAGAFDHGLSYRGDITGFNWSRIPVTLIECGYLSNAEEDLLLQSEEYKLLIVGGIVQGMIDYFGGESMPEEYDGAS